MFQNRVLIHETTYQDMFLEFDDSLVNVFFDYPLVSNAWKYISFFFREISGVFQRSLSTWIEDDVDLGTRKYMEAAKPFVLLMLQKSQTTTFWMYNN